MSELKFIDLFAGAGGLSEGFIKQGYEPIAHVEMNKDACDTLRTRSVYHWLKENKGLKDYNRYLKGEINREQLWKLAPDRIISSVINKEISESSLETIFEKVDSLMKSSNVDLIIGGPPCQAYSVAGRARDPQGMKDDPRNHLYKYYVEFLKKYKPKMFVFENVPGIFSASNGEYLQLIFDAITEAGYEYKTPPKKVLNSRYFNVLQDRKRVIIIGWRNDLEIKYPDFNEIDCTYTIENDLFSDLPFLKNGEGSMGVSHYVKAPTKYLREFGYRNDKTILTQHIVRPNNENDLEIYKIAVENMNDGKRLNYATLPERLIKHNNIKSFTNRFQVVNGNGISHTVVAHIAMDGHYYIHPDIRQNRSISLREAARIQSFPDDYFFEGSRTAAFKQIGNAVPVLMVS